MEEGLISAHRFGGDKIMWSHMIGCKRHVVRSVWHRAAVCIMEDRKEEKTEFKQE